MSRISLLTDEVSNKIAAGEVVERPASVVKELVENSLDAGAKKITVRIEHAGERLVAVSDDGEGMDSDDALLCFEPHATSKIHTVEDITHIQSFGFRGEAMPSIASVARVSLKTRRRDSREGVCVTIEGGVLRNSVPAGCAPGTEICVRDLFFNVPARRKFLKTKATEERKIMDIVSVISLAHPDVAFELVCDGRSVLKSAACDKVLPRINDIFGKELAAAMVPLQHEQGMIRISGYIAKRGVSRPSRQEQKVFVNSRPVEALPVFRGIRDGCGPVLEKGRFQPAVLFIEMPAEFVDVNVHPTKREVRFRNEFELANCVRDAVALAMRGAADEENPFLRPSEPDSAPVQDFRNTSSEFSKPAPNPMLEEQAALLRTDAPVAAPEEVPVNTEPGDAFIHTLEQAKVNYRPISESVQKGGSSLFEQLEPQPVQPVQPVQPAPQPVPQHLPENTAHAAFPGPDALKIIGILEDTYIIATLNGGLVLIDQHAAHERVLYEKLLKGVNGVFSQKLLIPLTLELTRSEYHLAMSDTELLDKLGFSISAFGGTSIKMEAIPAAMEQDNAGGCFRELLAKIREEGASGQRTDLSLIARAACKAAVKAHDRLNMDECRNLLKQMAECDLPYCCPHGRPTIIHIPLREIQRRFGRVL